MAINGMETTQESVDVLIVGSGSAGLACALWLAIYNDRFNANIKYRVLEKRDGPLQLGQADGVQCRTVEIFESWGLGHFLTSEGYWVNEVCFWAAEEAITANATTEDGSRRRRIVRTGRTADVLPGLSHLPHVILNQARINGLMIEKARALNGLEVEYGWDVLGVGVHDEGAHPVEITMKRDGVEHRCRATYLLGSDGAHSSIRRALGIKMVGDSTNAIWGVMDIFPRTTFPDIRKKTTIRADIGNLIIIPREGGVMVRLYFQLPPGTDTKSVTLDQLQIQAKQYFYPYQMDFVKTKWWSAYSIGQRLADRMADKQGRVFLAGDACHTHSPKAGQGMNASLQDGYNIGWKLGAVLSNHAAPGLLQTYVHERHKYAEMLIEFDRYWSQLFHSESDTTPQEFSDAFVKAGVFTAGMAARYDDSPLTDNRLARPELAVKVVAGERCPSAQVVRLSDSKPIHLQSLLTSNGSWRILVFAGTRQPETLDQIGVFLTSDDGPYFLTDANKHSNSDRIETLVIMHGDRTKVELNQFHSTFTPPDPSTDISDINRIFFDDESYNYGHGRAYQTLGIDTDSGCIVIVRPDQYVSAVIGLDDYTELTPLFRQFLFHGSKR